ncbi:dienelactone hydrolase family protein [Saccharothrix algeriensis]|uniref:Dienelactone hydrolase n=1 Tax=Saccharothrix algeriensis TaxID=173560 RepID=A0A8T8HS81_9PSEU|nr:dienelactone hydrolase family protein [Saccharothrix algeriensis]MBM7812737.1 dienelactone hydrolase [Saccharothrix algeriensis]QTR01418.1 dienelactone hydrolase family protein [Saccharothrix algeriensis]
MSGYSAKQVLDQLGRPGGHPVLRGDLALVGLPGLVYTPESGLGLPAVAFGHGWLQPVDRYRALLRHLASWGIVAAAPGTQRGPLMSSRMLAGNLRTTLDVCTGVRLGEGAISVDPERLAVAGHSMGGGSAVLAAADDERVRAVVTLAASETRPSALDAARRVGVPGLHLAAGRDRIAPPAGHAEAIAQAWLGPVQLRVLPRTSHLGFAEGRHWSELLLDGKGERGAQKLARAMVTAFLLRVLKGERQWDVLLEHDVKGTELLYRRGALAAR